MKVIDPLPSSLKVLNGADIYTHGYLPVAAAYCQKLGLIDLVNEMVSSQMELKPGLIVQAMVLDTLSGRTPLYRLMDFMAQQDVELLLGTAADPSDFHDTTLARALDAIFESGPSKIVSALGRRAVQEFSLDTNTVSYDTTSTNVWGDYNICELEDFDRGPDITHGHSKDNQPQLKQFMTELLCVDRGVPIFSSILDGNSSDKTSSNKILSQISTIMAKNGLGPGAFVFVGDSAMIFENNLKQVDPNLFVSRLPATYCECARAIEDAVNSNQWVDLGCLAQIPTKGNRPSATYKVFETAVSLYEKNYRALVVHSSSHDKRRKKKLEKTITRSAQSLTDDLSKLPLQFYCEADAIAAAQHIETFSKKLHTVKTKITTHQVRKPGRPPVNRAAVTNTLYTITFELVLNTEAVEREKQLAGCFVLLSNIPIDGDAGMDSKKLFLTYKGQYCVESDFAFLKDPLIVNDIFLKKPHRIDALGMILVIALMVYRLMERTMRMYLKETKTDLIGWEKRKTDKPTSFMLSAVMFGIMVVKCSGNRIFLHPPNSRQSDYLAALGLTTEVFLSPSFKCKPLIAANQEEKG